LCFLRHHPPLKIGISAPDYEIAMLRRRNSRATPELGI
jgi:hypothetical protein